MPVDINLFRKEKGGDPDIVRKSEAARCRDGKIVDEVIELDEQWRKYRHELNLLNKELGAVSKIVSQKKKDSKGEDQWEEEKLKANEINERIADKNQEVKKVKDALDRKINEVGNIVHETVLADTDEDNNIVVRTWGEINDNKVDGTLGHMNHHHVMRWLGMYDPERGSKIAGHRGYFLKNFGVLLNQALINYSINFLIERGYTVLQTPYFMRKEYMEKTWEIGDYEANLYEVENNESYLIATSEQPISAMHADEWLKVKDLPMMYCGFSSWFRKEAGSAGKDLWGIFRVHQFEKIEQFVICEPEKSWEMHEIMIKHAEEFTQSLGIAYRVVSIVGGSLNNAAAKKYDLEGWFPGYDNYRELVSCSNCTDYQSRAMNTKFGTKKKGEAADKNLVHMLNATLCATGRIMCAIVENYQTPEGVRIPEVLQPFLGGKDFVPWDEEGLKYHFDEVEQEKIKAQKKADKKANEAKPELIEEAVDEKLTDESEEAVAAV